MEDNLGLVDAERASRACASSICISEGLCASRLCNAPQLRMEVVQSRLLPRQHFDQIRSVRFDNAIIHQNMTSSRRDGTARPAARPMRP